MHQLKILESVSKGVIIPSNYELGSNMREYFTILLMVRTVSRKRSLLFLLHYNHNLIRWYIATQQHGTI